MLVKQIDTPLVQKISQPKVKYKRTIDFIER